MSRRYRKQDENLIFEIASQSGWKALFFMAFILWFSVFIIFPSFAESNFIYKAFLPVVKLVSGVIIFIFVISGISKLFLDYRNDKAKPDISYLSDNTIRPKGDSRYSDFSSLRIEPDIQRPVKDQEWSLELLRTMDWKRFEDLCSAYFTEKKIKNEQTSLGADDGIDLLLYENNLPAPTALVQCKRYTGVIGVTLVREFVGVMHNAKIHRGYFFTSSTFNQAAIDFAKSNNLKLIDGESFLSTIKGLPVTSQSKLLALATEGDYITPTCAQCGCKMILRAGKLNKFWGCRNFPSCRSKLAYSNK